MDLLVQELAKNPLAWYAALISTASLFLSLFSLGVSFWVAGRDKARITVFGASGYKVTPGGPYQVDRDYILITVSNDGRRPRIISKVGLRLKPRRPTKHVMAMDSAIKGPREIKESGSDVWVMEYGDRVNLRLDDIRDVWACDQTGKMYRGKFERL